MAALDDDRSHAVSETTAPANMIAASSDQQLRDALDQFKGHKVCIQYSSQYCEHCHQMLPHFMRLSKQFTGVKYVLAQLDYLQEEATDISYTPTYTVHNAKGKKVDEFFGVNPQKLDDHLWLHS